jgi:uridine kinase
MEFYMQIAMGNAKPLVVGISGISGSGKTVLTKLLAYQLNATAIYWDDFDEISRFPEDYVAWYDSGSPGGANAWDYPLLADTIKRLKLRETVTSPATREKLESENWIVFDAPFGRDHKQTASYIDFFGTFEYAFRLCFREAYLA